MIVAGGNWKKLEEAVQSSAEESFRTKHPRPLPLKPHSDLEIIVSDTSLCALSAVFIPSVRLQNRITTVYFLATV